MPLFLTRDQLRDLTGYVMPSKQIEWLTKNGVPHFVNAFGRPVVPAGALDKPAAEAYQLGPVR